HRIRPDCPVAAAPRAPTPDRNVGAVFGECGDGPPCAQYWRRAGQTPRDREPRATRPTCATAGSRSPASRPRRRPRLAAYRRSDSLLKLSLALFIEFPLSMAG